MKTKILGGFSVIVIASLAAFNLNLNSNSQNSDLSYLDLNVLAYAQSIAEDANSADGNLWKEYFYDCYINGQIRVEQGCAGISAGIHSGTSDIIAKLDLCGAKYTYAGGTPGVKSYCFDGPNLCWSNSDCQ